MITPKTQLCAVIGNPIEHSLSPVMQNWMIDKFNLDFVYAAFHVRDERVENVVTSMKTLGITGLNVTVPHKEKIIPFADTTSDAVKKIGAANTLSLNNDSVHAHVTDPYGFMESLGENKNSVHNASVLLIGAGGAAKSIAFGLAQLGANELFVTDLVEEKANELVETAIASGIKKSQFVKSNNVSDFIPKVTIIINATAVGMHPNTTTSPIKDYSAINSNYFVYDVIYNPAKTELLKSCKEKGALIQNGLEMLIFQGLESLRLWSGKQLELEPYDLKELVKIMNNQLGIHE